MISCFVLFFWKFKGHDTTTSAITFTLYNLAKHPEVQQKCFNEVCDVFGKDVKHQRQTTLALLNQLSYLELAIKETLRLFPPVPLVSRRATEDIRLSKIQRQLLYLTHLLKMCNFCFVCPVLLQHKNGSYQKIR